ncbi:inactive serine protease scarface-like [Anopheles marshallii]|uniref:inactive serine protease scarface-like n=1 Tax=Anopheles marshallii TaxID=1521116 RepID=UPI00237A8140|nr:inactive serine protease scarface-like [Anopheles marshallii]
MRHLRWKEFTFARVLFFAVICFNNAGTSLSCNCVPESLCPAPDVDLRLVAADEECPVGMLCCDVPVNDKPTRLSDKLDGEPFCDGVCVSDRSECDAREEYDEYGADAIDIRSNDGKRCPGGQYCCTTTPDKPASCDGTCLPRSLCTVFEPGVDCGSGKVCCRMERTSWVDMINDINGMAGPDSVDERPRPCEWSALQADGTRVPPWLVSVWARVEIIPGLRTDQFICGGVLVDQTLVLTTASHVKHLPKEELFVNVGDYDISSRSALRMANIYTLEEKIVHEDYSPSDAVHNDVALLRLTDTVRNGRCVAALAASSARQSDSSCYTIGWNRTLLGKGFGHPKRYPVQVTTFQDDLFCAPGTLCLGNDGEHCNDDSLDGSAIVCEEGGSQGDWKLRGLLVSNCTGVAIESVGAWFNHQRNPAFVQQPKPADPSRQYLPVL